MISSLELAKLCGVSQGTVDRALHGRAGISAKTRERILAQAKQHGYRPNPAARELLTGQSGTIGAIVPSVNNIFFMDLFNEMGRRLKERHLRLQLTPVESREDFLAALEDFAARRHRMALVIPPEEDIPIPPALAKNILVVSLVSPCQGKNIHFLVPDEEQIGKTAVNFLYHQGHRRILHLTYTRQSHSIGARARGYRDEMRRKKLHPQVETGLDRKGLEKALATARPTAIFCHNDWLALATLLQLSELGLRVPEDVSVMGVDNSPTLMAINPYLTTIAYPVESIGQAALNLLDGKSGLIPKRAPKIIERKTVRSI